MKDQYQNPLITRYASSEMSALWSAQRKFSTWRKLWIALAETQQELGLDISDAQLAELRQHVDDIDFEVARRHEKVTRHDVMAHVNTYGDVCPLAKPIIHLGATSCYVTDNTDLILLRESLELIRGRLVQVIQRLASFAEAHRDLPCLGFTHLQPAQPTTVGKRACLWLYDLVMDYHELGHRIGQLKARSTKGTTGTQATFLDLFEGNHELVRELEQRVARKIGFAESYAVTGQTYSRKVDAHVLHALSGIAMSAHKMTNDIRILASRKELEEPFEQGQIGSSAMAYKRNPMRSERVGSLARFVMSLESSATNTAATQWMERTLDDSANRRLSLPQAFLATDAVLILLSNIASGMVVYPQVIQRNLDQELPFMATEAILMAAVQQGGDRQVAHEEIRKASQLAGDVVKQEGKPNDLLERLSKLPTFANLDLASLCDGRAFIGRAAEQVDEFIEGEVAAILATANDAPGEVELQV